MKQLLVILFFLCSMSVSAQDVIVKKDGSTVVCRVVEVTESEIIYKKWSEQNGSNYVMERSAASAINYQNGKKVSLSEAANLYKPGNQNTGEHNYNDNALLEIDANDHPRKKIKIKVKWVAKAGFSLDKLTGGDKTSSTAGYDVSFGVAFPFKNNVVLGVDASIYSIGSHLTASSFEDDDKISCLCFGLSPYIGYKFSLNNRWSLLPYIGPYTCTTTSDKSPKYGYDYDIGEIPFDNSYRWWITKDHQFGFNFGIEVFFSSSFFIDIHYRKGSGGIGSEQIEYKSKKIKNDLTPLKLVLGVGYQF